MLRHLAGSALMRRVCSVAIDQVGDSRRRQQRPARPLRAPPPRPSPPPTAPPLPSATQSSHASWLPSLPAAAAAAAAAAQHRLPRCFAAQAAPLEDDDPSAGGGAGPPLPPLPLDQHTQQGGYRDLEVPLYDMARQQVGTYVLGGDVFDVPIRRDILHRVVRWQLARRQAGTHKTKTRSEVRGGGRKPWAQKGSGRARQGTIRAPQWRGGGVAHGPVPRSHEHRLFKRVRRLGLQCALSAKAWERRLLVVDSLRPADHRTKTLDAAMEALLVGAPRRSVLLVDSDKAGDDGG
jgi:50S ribosomal protein L4